MTEFLFYKISRYPDSVMNALSILIILITGQGCIANVLFTVLLGDNHPCKPENLKVGFHIKIFPRLNVENYVTCLRNSLSTLLLTYLDLCNS